MKSVFLEKTYTIFIAFSKDFLFQKMSCPMVTLLCLNIKTNYQFNHMGIGHLVDCNSIGRADIFINADRCFLCKLPL